MAFVLNTEEKRRLAEILEGGNVSKDDALAVADLAVHAFNEMMERGVAISAHLPPPLQTLFFVALANIVGTMGREVLLPFEEDKGVDADAE